MNVEEFETIHALTVLPQLISFVVSAYFSKKNACLMNIFENQKHLDAKTFITLNNEQANLVETAIHILLRRLYVNHYQFVQETKNLMEPYLCKITLEKQEYYSNMYLLTMNLE